MRRFLAASGIEELGFGTDTEAGCTWIILARTDRLEDLHSAVWRAWPGRGSIQESIALREIPGVAPDPDISAN